MSHKPEIGLHLSFKFFIVPFGHTFVQILLRAIADIRSPWFDIGSEEEYALFAGIENNLSLMEFELEFLYEEVSGLYYHIFEDFPV